MNFRCISRVAINIGSSLPSKVPPIQLSSPPSTLIVSPKPQEPVNSVNSVNSVNKEMPNKEEEEYLKIFVFQGV